MTFKWSANITAVAKDSDTSVVVTVDFNNANSKRTLNLKISDVASLRRQLQNYAATFENIDDFAGGPPLGPFEINDPPQPPQPPPTALELYQRQRGVLVVAKQDLDMGLIDQPAYDVILQATKAMIPPK